MGEVWYAIPSAKRLQDWSTIPLWIAVGYKVAVFRDPLAEKLDVDINHFGTYKGYAHAVNTLVHCILEAHPSVEWIVTGGDDIEPDAHRRPETIAMECSQHFGGTFGIMQPTGDQDHMRQGGTCATERVCESPWMGSDWCKRAYQGEGPLCEEYFHFFVDEELHNVAKALGVLWHRQDVTHLHHHWTRSGPHKRPRPEYLNEAKLNWKTAQELFNTRKAAGFPKSIPLVSAL